MRIAVIGGGASGLVTAYLLDGAHEVHVFERHPILGGNVRTLGGNVACSKLEEGVITENGVSWFLCDSYPNTHRLLDELGVEQETRLLDSSIVLAIGQSCQVSVLDRMGHLKWDVSLSELVDLGEGVSEFLYALRFIDTLPESEFSVLPLETVLQELNHLFAQWLRGVVAASFSVPFAQVGQFPAHMVLPLLRSSMRDRRCTVLRGGMYSYMQEILNRFRGTIHADVQVSTLRRHNRGVSLMLPGGTEEFDRVVIATTPECALRLLADPSPEETRGLGRWRDSTIRTVAHVSEAIYRERRIAFRTPCDCFERSQGDVVGYNCCLNDLYGIRSKRQYSFGAQLENWIEPDKILDVQQHVTALFDVSATAHRDEIRHLNGRNNTYYAGAYLFDGFHEGAITSAMEVAEKLGGRRIGES